MAAIKATDALRLLNIERGCNLSYPKFNRHIVSGEIPAERSDDGRSWMIDEDDLDAIATRMSAAPGTRRSAA